MSKYFGFPSSTMDECFQWIKYKTENFHHHFLSSFDLKDRIELASKHNHLSNKCLTWRMDGVHIPINIRTKDDGEVRIPIPHKSLTPKGNQV